MSLPCVSIAMPFRNSERTISQTIRSLLAQTFEDFELLLYDDGSSDRSGEIARSFCDRRIVVCADGQHRHLARRLNECIARARGRWLARMDADDIAFPNRLATQVVFLEENPEIDLCGGQAIVFGADGTPLWHYVPPPAHEDIISFPARGFPMWHPTWMGKSSWFRKWQYEETALLAQDQEMLLRSYRHSTFANTPAPVLGYRQERVSLKKLAKYKSLWIRYVFQHEGRSMTSAERFEFLAVQGVRLAANSLSAVGGTKFIHGKQDAEKVSDPVSRRWQEIWRFVSELPQTAPECASGD
jgi:glycosyltransferase involved in cell wall biosynthesis